MKCVIHYYAYTTDGGAAYGHSTAASRCTTHGWDFGTAPTAVNTQCPIGRIDDKLDEVLAKIDQHLQAHQHG